MAKRKTRRTAAVVRDTSPGAQQSAVKTSAAVSPAPGRRPDLNEEYHYVLRDLRQIAIIAAILIAGLVALSFILQ